MTASPARTSWFSGRSARLGRSSGRPVPRHAADDLRFRVLGPDPARHPHPLAGLEILVMLEEVRYLPGRQIGEIANRFDRPVETRQLVDRHGQDLAVAARLVI